MYTTKQGTRLNEQEYELLKEMYNRYCLQHIFEQGYDLTDVIQATEEATIMGEQTSDDLFQFFLDYFELICFDEWVENDFPNYNTIYLNELLRNYANQTDEEEIKLAKKIQKKI